MGGYGNCVYNCDLSGSRIKIHNIPIREGYETRLKYGYLVSNGPGVQQIYNEGDSECTFIWMGNGKLPLPPGKYRVKQKHVGEFPVEIKDGETFELKVMNPGKIPNPKWKSVPIITKTSVPIITKTKKGRLNCFFPDSENFVRLYKPNSGTTLHILDTMKFVDVEEGNYRLYLNGIWEDIFIEANKETRMRVGYVLDMLEGPWNLIPQNGATGSVKWPEGSRKIALPVGYYKAIHSNPPFLVNILIKVNDGETVIPDIDSSYCY
jgi:hypothetical protein